MAVSTRTSLALSVVLATLIYSTMQIYRPFFVATQLNTILGGFLGSWLFILSLTAVSNLETIMLGDGFQATLFPEITSCLLTTVFACGLIHRVCASTCLMFSLLALYYVNILSQKAQTVTPAVDSYAGKKKRK